jgi:4a-hydroxytetrahydrobiopterin dehydratase
MNADHDALARTRVRPGAPALSAGELAAALDRLPGWQGDMHAIARTFRFDGWRATIAFVDALAALADDVDHHPDLVVGYGKCEVRWSTHDAGGVTANDLACAARTDALVGR